MAISPVGSLSDAFQLMCWRQSGAQLIFNLCNYQNVAPAALRRFRMFEKSLLFLFPLFVESPAGSGILPVHFFIVDSSLRGGP